MNARSPGRSAFGPRWTPRQRYLLDHSLNPRLAEALRLASWDIWNVMELFGVDAHTSVPDQEIIPRCAQEEQVWITADDAARRQHELAMKQHLISVLWVSRPKDGMSTAYQHAHLAPALLLLDYELTGQDGHALHFRLGSSLHAKPVDLWKRRRPG